MGGTALIVPLLFFGKNKKRGLNAGGDEEESSAECWVQSLR
jgi:hypothetical protein